MRLALIGLFAVFFPGSTLAADQTIKEQKQAAPEIATSGAIKPLVIAQKHMVVAANPYAAEAGRAILRQGGSAADAAIATQLVLNLVEPQSSGIGGGAFILLWDAKQHSIETIDGRETAPATAKPERFLGADGKPLEFDTAVNSGLSTGVPGVVSALALAHKQHGNLPWSKLFEPAIALAEGGFTVSPRLAKLLADQGPNGFSGDAKALYFDAGGKSRMAGETLKNPAFAATLRTLASGGADAFYQGDIAKQILAALAAAPRLPGDMTAADLSRYAAKPRDAVCIPYRGYKVCGMGPPSSGGTTVAMVLGMIGTIASKLPVADLNPHTAMSALLSVPSDTVNGALAIAEAEKLAYADRDQYIADPDFVPQPSTLTDPGYLSARAKLIDLEHPIAKATAGMPPLQTGMLLGADATNEHAGTSHISVVDDAGNAVSMTTSIETAFGSRLMAGGFLLNNQLTDFSFTAKDDKGWPIANRVEPGKRPRSSMAPAIVLGPDGNLFAVLGAPGGSRIILYDIKTIACLIDWHCNAEEAADLPGFGSRNGPFEVEQGTSAETILGPLAAARGETIKAVDMNTGVHVIVRRDGHLEGGADHRREGVALGD